jgi:hypothetical protein
VDIKQLTQANANRKYSGSMMYSLYLEAWRANNGHLTINQFVTLMLSYEFQPYEDTISDGYKATLKDAAGNWFWCSPNADTNQCTNLRQNGGASNAAMLNWVAGMESARDRYDAVFRDGADAGQMVFGDVSGSDKNMPLAKDVLRFVLYESKADGHLYLNQPFYWANLSLPLNINILYASQGAAYNQYLMSFGQVNPAYILTPCQTAYWRGNAGYLHDVCGVD